MRRTFCTLIKFTSKFNNARRGFSLNYLALLASRSLVLVSNIFFLNLIFLGVISTISSSCINSIAYSNDIWIGGTKRNASSEPEALVFVKCFSLHTLIAKSSPLEFNPTIIPSYTSTPGPINNSPLSCALYNP